MSSHIISAALAMKKFRLKIIFISSLQKPIIHILTLLHIENRHLIHSFWALLCFIHATVLYSSIYFERTPTGKTKEAIVYN